MFSQLCDFNSRAQSASPSPPRQTNANRVDFRSFLKPLGPGAASADSIKVEQTTGKNEPQNENTESPRATSAKNAKGGGATRRAPVLPRLCFQPPMSVRLSGVETPTGTLGVFLRRVAEVTRAGALLTAAKVKSTAIRGA